MPEGSASPKDEAQSRGGKVHYKTLAHSYIRQKKITASYCLERSRSSQALDLWYLDTRKAQERWEGVPLPYMDLLVLRRL